MTTNVNFFSGKKYYLDLERFKRKMPLINNLPNLTQETIDAKPIHYQDVQLPKTVEATIRLIVERESSLPRSMQLNITRPLLHFLDRKTTLPKHLIPVFVDIAKAILWIAKNDEPTKALLEFTSDLWDGFIFDRRDNGTHLPDYGIEPPIVKWDFDSGPYTYTEPTTSQLGIKSPVVNMPAKTRDGGLAAWVALAHEVTGHDLLHSYEGLRKELGNVVYDNLASRGISLNFTNYWERRIDETASDILGVLNLGPSFAYGLIAYFRSFSPSKTLSTQEYRYDEHPLGILRAYVIAYAIRYLNIDDAKIKSDTLIQHINFHDLETRPIKIWMNEHIIEIPHATARETCDVIAYSIMKSQLKTLGNHPFCQVRCWNNSDEKLSDQYAKPLENPDRKFVDEHPGKYFASHVVAQAVKVSLRSGANIPLIFNRMIAILNVMHNSNEQWKYPSLYNRVVGCDFEDGSNIVEFRPYQNFLNRFYFINHQKKPERTECTIL